MRLIHVDNLPLGATATTRMLQAGVGAYNTSLPVSRGQAGTKHVDLEVVHFNHFEAQSVIEDPSSTIALVTVPERELSCRTGEKIAPCRSLMTAQKIIKQNPRLRVFLIPISSVTPMTGVDVVAALLSGASGIIDERGLVMQEVISEVVAHNPVARRSKSMLLIGELTIRLHAMKDMVDEWGMDDHADPTLDLASWRAAMALAQLEKLEILIGTGRTTSFSTLADALNLAQPVTSFWHNPDDLRRVLATLARRWLGEDHEPRERFNLPTYARNYGFPRHHPVLLGLDYANTTRKIFHTLQEIEIRLMEDLIGMGRRLIRMR